MTAIYEWYGLRVFLSEPLPGLEVVGRADGPEDVAVHLRSWPAEAVPDARSWTRPGLADADPGLGIWRSEDGSLYRFLFRDGTAFAFNSSGTSIWATWPPGVSLPDIGTYLLGPVLGYLLRLRGTLSLHGSCVAIEGNALALIGGPGAGKSTTASVLAIRGCEVLSDDVTPLQLTKAGGYAAVPGPPRLCVWPESSAALLGDPDALPRITEGWEKRELSAAGGVRFAGAPVPLRVIYAIADRAVTARAPVIEPLPAARGLMALVANTYGNLRLDLQQRAEEFRLLDQLLRTVEVRRVVPGADIAQLDALADLLLSDFRQLAPVR